MYLDDKEQTHRSYKIMTMDVQIPPKIQRFHNVNSLKIRLTILCLSASYWGYSLGYLSTIPTQLMINQYGSQSQVPLIKGFLDGVLTLGAAVGSLCSPFFLSCFTRRNLILLLNICALIIACILQYTNLYCLYICRGLQGFLVGNFMALVSLYIDQLTPKDIIETFGVFTELFSKIGLVTAFGLGTILSKSGVQNQSLLRAMFGFDMIPISLIIISCLLGIIPESPNSLIMKGQDEQAKKVINMFIKTEFVQEVFKEKLMEVEYQKASAQDKDKTNLKYGKKAYFIGFLLPLMKQLTGTNAIASQIGGMVEEHNQNFGYYTPLIINSMQILANFAAIAVLNSFGRRTVILAGNFTIGIFNIIMGVLFFYINQYPSVFWMLFTILILYMLTINLTLGPVIWMYVPEILPTKMVPVATTFYWLGCSLCLIVLPIIKSNLGSYAFFFIFGGITLAFAVINFFGLIQTKGLTRKQVCDAYRGIKLKIQKEDL